MGGPGMGGPGMGGGMMGGPGMGGPGMSGPIDPEEEPPKPIVELPNYELNLSRRRAKLIVFSVQQLLANDAIVAAATEKHKAGLDPLDKRIDEFMVEDSNIGVVDLARVSDDDEIQKESFAIQLKKAFKGMSGEMANAVAKMRGEAAPAAAAPEAEGDDAPAADTPFGN